MVNGYGAAIGSVSTGCVERVSFRNLTIDNAGCGCWIKLTNGTVSGAFVRDVAWTDVRVTGQSDNDQCGVVSISALYEESSYSGRFVCILVALNSSQCCRHYCSFLSSFGVTQVCGANLKHQLSQHTS